MRKSTISLNCIRTILCFVFVYILSFSSLTSQCDPGQISGTVFVDEDLNGFLSGDELGHSGIIVKAYNNLGSQVGQDLTNINGEYTINGLTNTEQYTIAFTVPSNIYVAPSAFNGGDVQINRAPHCDTDLPLILNSSSCEADTEIFLTCFVNGQGSNRPTQETIVGLTYSFNGASSVQAYANQSQTGSVWGLNYSMKENAIFSASFVKQHASLINGSHDVIYKTALSGSPSTSIFADLSLLGQNTGTLSSSNSGDCNYGAQVGKIGLGALVMDEDEDHLFVVNLFNNSVVKLDASNPTNSTTVSYQIPNPGCSFNDYRAFALKMHQGKLYVGVTCTGETSQDENDTSIHVYSMNLNSGNFSLEFSTDFSKGYWNDQAGSKSISQWLTDIDFTDDGNMVLGISDRTGHKYCDANSSRIDDQYGDILMVSNNNGTWILENNGSVGSLVGNGVGNGEGPGGGEFFGDDFFPGNPGDHSDVATGSIFILPGTNQVVSTVFDPIFNTYSGGLHRYDTRNGNKVASKELYNRNIEEYFGKATGFGDLDARCGAILSSIGNYVWLDSNNNGLQDSDESGLGGIKINLYDTNCNLVNSTVTDLSGFYEFNGLPASTDFFIQLDQSIFDPTTMSYILNGVYHFPTIANSNTQLNSDIDFVQNSCLSTNGPVIGLTTAPGFSTGFDIGLKLALNFDLALDKKVVAPSSIIRGQNVTFAITIYNQGGVVATATSIVDYLTPAFTFDQSLNPGWQKNGNELRFLANQILLPGQSLTENLVLGINPTGDINDLVNVAEIRSAFSNTGLQANDIDSTPDNNPNNDIGGIVDSSTDDLITDDGTLDEDDHDPAKVKILDLALKNEILNNRAYDIGDIVTFEMTVYNQGNVAVTSFDISNSFPGSLDFDPSLNPGWIIAGVNLAQMTSDVVLNPGDNITYILDLKINNTATTDDIVDRAEISSFIADCPASFLDFDSTPDADFTNDAGGDPYNGTDNVITGDGTIDEDDNDPAVVNVRIVDLALMKTTERAVVNVGGLVEYKIEIYNQGDVAMSSVMLVDYLPDNTTIADASWILNPNDPTGRSYYKTINFPSGFGPGDSHVETITIEIGEDTPGGFLINEAEIAQVFDTNGLDVSNADIDSTPDSNNANDAGGVFATSMDDFIGGNGLNDEDDHDPSGIYIPTISITDPCLCLNNGSTVFDGQFSEEVTVLALSGQIWYVDTAFDIFNPTSPTPPATPVAYATGPMGYTLVENDLGDGTSEYVLDGIIITDQPYSIRVTNGNGAFLQISGGGSICSYEQGQILGNDLSAVCAGATSTYGAQLPEDCEVFRWTLSGGGSIIGSATGPTVKILWGSAPGAYTLEVETTCVDVCLSPVQTVINIGSTSAPMSCRHDVNVSLGPNCSSELTADMFLTSPVPSGVVFQLMLIDAHGQPIPNNFVTENHLWTTIMAKVIDPCDGNSCWANVSIEDKLPPQIQCDDIQMPCWQVDAYEPLITDNCSTFEYEMIGETIQPLHCDDDFIKEVVRTFIAVDGYGNESQPCQQTIKLERIKVNEIVFPDSLLIKDMTNLSCHDSIFDSEGRPRTDLTGVPTINGHDLFPVGDFYCNFGLHFRDFVVTEFGCVKKIMRTWTAYEDWCIEGESEEYVQIIEITDDEPAMVTCNDITVSSDGTPNCEAIVTIPLPTIEDNCTNNFVIDVSTPEGFIRSVSGPVSVTLNAGTSQIVFNVYDGCENLTPCIVNVTVKDEIAPVAVCDKTTAVSLRSDGKAKAFAHTFDDGSYDDCSLAKLLVKRIGSNCDCERPVFDNFRYLGELNGRMYYLSRQKTHGQKAFDYSTAYGASIVVLESELEHDWVYEKASQFVDDYYIGLSDKGHPDLFTWPNHAEPIYDKFTSSMPITGTGVQNVIVTATGDWLAVDGNAFESYYIMEATDPCGFSDEVRFCCEDVTQEQMVVFRAIDYFGKFNDCMVNVEVQDKVAPVLTCPSDRTVNCDEPINLDDLSEFGIATATDQCGFELDEDVMSDLDMCGKGTIVRTFTATDNNGFSTCQQVLTFINPSPFDFDSVKWPEDYTTNLGCGSGDLLPENLPEINGFPMYTEGVCDLVAATYKDQTFSFAGTSADACLKILRTWTVIDWCQSEEPGYMPLTYEQTIKVSNTQGPTILTGCDPLNISTVDCEFGKVVFSVEATDDCTPLMSIQNQIQIDFYSDGSQNFTDSNNSNIVSFDGQLPIGVHTAQISFSDLCGNTTTCTKIITVVNDKTPTAACINGISVALEPMDLDNDGIPETEMACIFPEMIDASSTHICDNRIILSFSADTLDTKKAFDCGDLGPNIVELWVTDEFGNTDFCQTVVVVQDNNNVDFCPTFDLALRKTTISNGPYMPGSDVTFNLEVINQGNQSAFNIELEDYIPNGLNLNDANWTDQGNGIAALNTPIPFLQDSTSTSVPITFTIDPAFMGFSITNTAEISFADDDNDPTNEPPTDVDSNPDDINDDIVGGDNEIDNTNGDEDDHDPEIISIQQDFDLTLSKECSTNTPGPFMQGSTVTYLITVSNEGTLDASNVFVRDYIPNGLLLADNNWTQVGSVATINNPIAFIQVGGSQTVGITFTIDPTFMGTTITNVAEIADPNGTLPDDIDSTPSNDDGDQSEDDEDDKTITVGQTFDLALTKMIDATSTPGPYNPGDDVTFTITVINQSGIDATNVRVADYILTGFTLNGALSPGWTANGSNAEFTIPVLAANSSTDVSITLRINSNYSGVCLINSAEIISADNALGLDDEDSDLDNVNDGTNPELTTDNDISDTSNGSTDNPNDEDDYDPAKVDVVCDLAPICLTQDITVSLDSGGSVSITAAQIDNGSSAQCDGATVQTTLNQTFFNCQSAGNNTVTLTVLDSAGNNSSCTANVAVTAEPPVANCSNITVNVDANGMANITEAQINNGSTAFCQPIQLSLDRTMFDCTSKTVVSTVVLTVTDALNQTDQCFATVTVQDLIPPTVDCINDFVINLDDENQIVLSSTHFYNSASDNCLPVSVVASEDTFSCDDIGSPVLVNVTATDPSNNTAVCDVTVTVMDTGAPTCTLLMGQSFAPFQMIMVEDLLETFNDNCSMVSANSTVSPIMFVCEDLGTQIVTVTVTDDSNNASTCSASVTIEDISAPMCVANDIDVSLNAGGTYTFTQADIDAISMGTSAGCAGIADIQLSETMFDCDDAGTNITLTLTVTSNNGMSASCMSQVSVVDDINPLVECVDDFTIDLDSNGEFNFDIGDIEVSSSDGCPYTTALDITMLDCDDKGAPTTVTLTATDDSGNTNQCTTDITVEDNEAPTCTLDQDITIAPMQMVTEAILGFEFDDNCADVSTMTEIEPDNFDCDDLGEQVITVTVNDGCGNSGTCQTTVSVEDNSAPICMANDIDISLDAMGVYTFTPADIAAITMGSTAGCAGIADTQLSQTMFDCDDAGTSIALVLTITSNNGMSASCMSQVSIVDDIIPLVECEDNFTIDLDSNGEFNFNVSDIEVSSSDGCPYTLALDITMLDCDNKGTPTTVTLTATDESGNTNQCTTVITVEDNEAPTCTLDQDITIAPMQMLTEAILGFEFDDNCADVSSMTEIDPDNFDCDDLGDQVITVTVNDGCGNSGTCQTTVSVEDNSAPICVANDITVELDVNGEHTLTQAEIDAITAGSSAGCAGIQSIELNETDFLCNDMNQPFCLEVTITSNNGMTAECEAKITVEDNIAPALTCVDDFAADLDEDGEFNFNVNTIEDTSSDGCSYTLAIDITQLTCLQKDIATTVTVTATDEGGNSSTCQTDITVEDNTAPTCVLLENQVFAPNEVITYDAIIDEFDDNCADESSASTVVPNVFDCTQLGEQLITVTVNDDCGNSGTCTTTVTIEDNSIPTCVTMDITVNLDENGMVSIAEDAVDNGSTGTCSDISFDTDPTDFDCDDIGDNIVTLTVTSSGGGSSSCTATVTVNDPEDPIIVCPADMTVECGDDVSDLSIFGMASVVDNCPIDNFDIIETVVNDLNSCGVGTITRTFTATDPAGNAVSCDQVITIENGDEFTEADILWPPAVVDFNDCFDPNNLDTGTPTFTPTECSDITGPTFVDDPDPTTLGCMGSFTRTWTISDACTGNVFTFEQTINLNDQTGPMISGPANVLIEIDSFFLSCDTLLSLPATVTDCVGGFTSMNDSPAPDANTSGPDASGTYSGGITPITITATDVCGNTSTYSYTVSVVDVTASLKNCQKIIGQMTSAEEVTIDISASMATVCTICDPSSYTISWSNTDPNQSLQTFDCSFVGITNYTVYLWSGGVLVDQCSELLQILDGGGFCNTPMFGDIGGEISTEAGDMIENTSLNLKGGEFQTKVTDENGKYAFPEVPFGSAYEVVPIKDVNPLNGVSTLDLIKIQQHILGDEELSSPYKVIAADVDRSGSISTIDLVHLRKLLLGIYEEFPNNSSWRMVDSQHKFIDPHNPFFAPLKETYEIFNLQSDMDIDFIGVKIGDVNNTAKANVYDHPIEERSSKKFIIDIEDQKVKAGELVEVVLTSKDLKLVNGLQFTLNVDNKTAEILSFDPMMMDLDSKNVNLEMLKYGKFNLSWNTDGDVTGEEKLFALQIVMKSDAELSKVISLDVKGITAEAYYDDKIMDVMIDFTNHNNLQDELVLYQNLPNPWSETTEIKFFMPSDNTVAINIYDINGRKLYNKKLQVKVGINRIEIQKSEVNSSGVLYYELLSGDQRLMNKMLLIK